MLSSQEEECARMQASCRAARVLSQIEHYPKAFKVVNCL